MSVSIIVGKDFNTGTSNVVSKGTTVASLAPSPQESFKCLYNRIVLDPKYDLSKLPNGSRIDFVTVNPPLIPISGQTVTVDAMDLYGSNTYISSEKHDFDFSKQPVTRPIAKKFYLLADGNYYMFNNQTNSYSKVVLASNNLAIYGDALFAVPNSNAFEWTTYTPESIFIPDPLVTEPIRTMATGAAIGMAAVGPQESYLYTDHTDWTPNLTQHTNFSIFQKKITIPNGPYLGNTLTCKINPGETGDLIGPMYLQCTLPYNINLIDRVGVALVDKYELYFDNILIDSYDSDWHTLYNDLFLTADEIVALEPLINGSDLLIPLRFFFCQKKKWLPICALKYQKVYIKIYFQQQSWFTDTVTPFDLTNVNIIYDTVFLTAQEKTYYMTTPLKFDIPKYYREVPVNFTQAYVNMNLTANFKVTMMIWFVRNFLEYQGDYTKRYEYGYISSLVRSYTSYINWKGQTKYYERVFDDLAIYINGKNIVSGIRDDLYFAYRQPMEAGLSVPDKNIYVYCFGTDIKSPTNNGFIDFSQYASKTTNIVINFRQDLISELIQQFQLYVYYYGYITLTIQNGYGSVQSVF
jgi:hypothetical protein